MKNNLNKIIEDITKEFKEKEKVRDECLKLQRVIIKLTSIGIREIHKNNIKVAERIITKVEKKLIQINRKISKFKDLYYSNLMVDVEKEYIELIIFYTIILTKSLLLPKKSNIASVAYIKGLSEVIGELRRYILELLRKEKFNEVEKLFDIMEEIYYNLISLNFSDSITGGLRKLIDTNRVTLEKTRSDLLYTKIRRNLNAKTNTDY